MPRIRNIYDYSTTESKPLPHETLIDVALNDSVKVITLHFEPGGYVQVRKLFDSHNESGQFGWQVITTFDTIISRNGARVTKD